MGNSCCSRCIGAHSVPEHLQFEVDFPAEVSPNTLFEARIATSVTVPVLAPSNAAPGTPLVLKPGCSGKVFREDDLTLTNVQGAKIVGDRCNVTGSFNLIEGDRCTVTGSFNLVDGDLNTVTGFQNALTGDRNRVNGRMNWLEGHRNFVTGERNYVEGDENLLCGDGNVCVGDENESHDALAAIEDDAPPLKDEPSAAASARRAHFRAAHAAELSAKRDQLSSAQAWTKPSADRPRKTISQPAANTTASKPALPPLVHMALSQPKPIGRRGPLAYGAFREEQEADEVTDVTSARCGEQRRARTAMQMTRATPGGTDPPASRPRRPLAYVAFDEDVRKG